MRRLVLVCLLALGLPAAGSTREVGGTPLALVATAHGDELLVLELPGGSVRARLPLPHGPRDVASTFDARRVLVASPAANAVTLLDARNARVLTIFHGIANPADVAVSLDGRTGYVLEKGSGRLLVLDLVRRRIAGGVAVGARPNRLAFSDSLAWVAHESRASTLTVVNIGNPLRPYVQGHLSAGGRVHTLTHVPDSAWLLVTYWSSGRVGKVDAEAPTRMVFRHAVGTRISTLGIDWLTGQIWVADVGGRIRILDGRNGRLLHTLRTGDPILAVGAYGGYMAIATRKAIRLFVGGKPSETAGVPAGINGVDFAVD